MNTVRVELSIDQLKQALQLLPLKEKLDLWRQLDTEIDRKSISERFSSAISLIRQNNTQYSEDEVMADAIKAVHEVRAKSSHAKNRSRY